MASIAGCEDGFGIRSSVGVLEDDDGGDVVGATKEGEEESIGRRVARRDRECEYEGVLCARH
jgi:hypothetical protein